MSTDLRATSPSLGPAAASTSAAPTTTTSARAARTGRISRSRFQVLGNDHADGVLPGGNVAETDARRFAAVFIAVIALEIVLVVALEIVLARGLGADCALHLGTLVLGTLILGAAKIEFVILRGAFFPHGLFVPDLIAGGRGHGGAARAAPSARPRADLL